MCTNLNNTVRSQTNGYPGEDSIMNGQQQSREFWGAGAIFILVIVWWLEVCVFYLRKVIGLYGYVYFTSIKNWKT